MMFAVRGIAVSFSIFFILYSVLSVAVCLGWRRLWLYGQQQPARRCADLLFILRHDSILCCEWSDSRVCCAIVSAARATGGGGVDGRGAVMLGCGGMAVMLAGAWNAAAGIGAGRENRLRDGRRKPG